MAYWHFCTACQQWSKSATPLSDDKTCSFCGKKYTKLAKKNGEEIVSAPEEVQTEPEMTETVEEPVAEEISAAVDEKEISAPDETVEDSEPPVSETIEMVDASEETVITEAAETLETTEIPETEETTAASEKADAPKIKKVPTNRISAEKKGRPVKKR
ncbi:MAG: hypothetical protein GXY49_06705 [Syntrophomonadaceae bacterium]|nr:hypothetical protein [Syntrophomonadaceae bacterium]